MSLMGPHGHGRRGVADLRPEAEVGGFREPVPDHLGALSTDRHTGLQDRRFPGGQLDEFEAKALMHETVLKGVEMKFQEFLSKNQDDLDQDTILQLL